MPATPTVQRAEPGRLESIEEALRRPNAVVVHRDGRVVAVSDDFLRLTGLSNVEGHRAPHPWWRAQDESSLAVILSQVLSGAADQAEDKPLRIAIRHADGRDLPVDVAFHRVRGEHVCFSHEPVDREAESVDSAQVRAALELLVAAFGGREDPAEPAGPPRRERSELEGSLTHREMQVLALLLEGRRSDRIAEALGLSRNTAKHHIQAVFRKCHVTSHVELLARMLDGREGGPEGR